MLLQSQIPHGELVAALLPGADCISVLRCHHNSHGVSMEEFSPTEPIPLQAFNADHSRNTADFSMACLGHDHIAVDSKNPSDLDSDFF